MLLAYLMQHSHSMKISYEKQNLEKKLIEIKRENETLEIETSDKTGLLQIDKEAAKLNMVKPTHIEYIIMSKGN